MTLARRIWLGFGVLLLSILALSLTAYLGVRAVHDDVHRLAGSEQKRSEAVEELRSQVMGTEALVSGYLETGDPRYRDEISQRARMFDKAEEQLARAVASEEGKKSVARAGDLYYEYTTTADELMRERDTRRELLPEVEEDLQKGRTILVDMQAGVEKTGGDAKRRELAEADQGLDGARTWLGAYLAHPQKGYKHRAKKSVDKLRNSLSRYKEFDLSESERKEANDLADLLDEALPSVERAISLTASIDDGESRLVGLRADMDEVLDELQQSARKDLSVATARVERTAGMVAMITLASLLAACVVGVLTTVFVGGGILGSVRRLATEARKIKEEDGDGQINISSDDELGTLAAVLNSVAEERKQDRDELEHLGGLLREEADRATKLESMIEVLRSKERETQEAERRNELAARALHYGVFEWDPRTDELDWDDTCLELLGLSRERFTSNFESFLSMVHPEDRQKVKDTVAEHLENGAEFDEEYRIRHADGGYRNVVSRVLTERGPEGEPLRSVGIMGDVTERRVLERELEDLAFYDPLTSLPNRALFMDRLKNALDRGDRQGTKVAVLFIDLDNFKNVNDSLGHESGDRALIEMAGRLQSCLRPGDTVARFGGDEFTVLLEKVGVVEARRVAERILDELEAPITVDGRRFYLTPSIGVAFGNPTAEPADLLRNADSAMYEAKRFGKARYEVFHTSMSEGVLERLELEDDLRRAVEEEEFVVYYQPKILLDSLRVFALEALVRWEHPRRGLLRPDEFINVAEETNLILPIGNWVLRQACGQVRAWQERHPAEPPIKVSVNLSSRQFRQPDLSESIAQVLLETGLAPDSLILEVEENVLTEESDVAGVTLQRLRDQRVSIAIDDFGKAYSSLARLKDWPIDTLNVDRSFIFGLGEDEEVTLVSGIINMVSGLGLTVIAEGVETSRQMVHLRTLGCSRAQGYYFSRPLPSQAVESLLERQSHR